MPPTKLWMDIKICTSPYVRPSVPMYIPKSCVRNSSYTHWWILLILAMLQVLHELWDFVSLFQNSSLSTFHQVFMGSKVVFSPKSIFMTDNLLQINTLYLFIYKNNASFKPFEYKDLVKLVGKTLYCPS